MAHLLKYADEPDRRVWRPASPEQIEAWREKSRNDLFNRNGRVVTLEDNTAHHMGWEQPELDEFGIPVFEVPKREKPREGREVAEMLTSDLVDQMLHWARYNPELFREKIKLMKQTGHMEHLTDEQAAARVHDLCRKLAESDVQRVHSQMRVGGGWKGAVLLTP